MLRREREEFPCLVDARARLHQDRAPDAGRMQERPQILGAKGSADRIEVCRHPAIRRALGIPKMMMTVDEALSFAHAAHADPSANAYSRSYDGLIVMLYSALVGVMLR